MPRPARLATAFCVCLVSFFFFALEWTAGAADSRTEPPSQLTADQATRLRAQLKDLEGRIAELEKSGAPYRDFADVTVFAKAVDWALRHNAFPRPDSAAQATRAIEIGGLRAELLKAGKSPREAASGCFILGYRSAIDNSIQPYALTLPRGFGTEKQKRWALHVVLHGRDDSLSEIKFIRQHNSKPPEIGADWIQLDVYGRCCNAYRWAGETDVFEAIKDVQLRYRIDDRRIVLHGFSMGGAGAWHLGLHYPSMWCSVGPGAGFIDFYKYQNAKNQLPAQQHSTLHIYDALDYVQNAFNVPICTYGGELDKQLVASTQMKDAADKLKIPMTVIVGPKVGHQFHPDSRKQFMAFHHEKQLAGRTQQLAVREIRFSTWSVKYNTCDWLTIEEQMIPYQESSVHAIVDDQGQVAKITTRNVASLKVARDIADSVEIDGVKHTLADAADRLLPAVYYESTGGGWTPLTYTASLDFPQNRDRRKRRNLQGPIDDAFMQPFVCVIGTGTPWSQSHQAWAHWTLQRFAREFDRWMHGEIQVVTDKQVTPELIQSKNLILFGDPGSNTVLAKIVDQLPFKWEKKSLQVAGKTYDPETHGVACIYPNPMNSRRYVVINSGHTFHEPDFRNSNAWLFPRLGDIAVLKVTKQPGGDYAESPIWAEIFDVSWRLPNSNLSKRPQTNGT